MVSTLAGHTAFAIAARLAGSLAGGTPESRYTHTIAILGEAGAPILAGAGVATVGSPEALRAGQVAAGTCPASLALAVSVNRVTVIRVVTVTAMGTAFTKLPLWTGELAVDPVPPRGAGTGSSLGAAGCLMGTLAAGIATESPGSRWAGHRAVTTLPTFLADAGAVDRGAGDGILAGAARGAVESVSVGRTEAGAVRARVAGRAPAEAAVGLAEAAVQAEAVLPAAGPVRVQRAALVAVKAGPARLARALPAHRVAAEAVLWVAGAGHLAAEAVEAVGAEALGAAVPGEAVFAQTRAVGEAAGPGGAVARLHTVLSEVAHRALLFAPLPGVARSAAALPSQRVAEATVVTAAFLGAVGSVEALGAGQGADGAHPARWAAAGASGGLEDTPVVARRGAGAEEANSVLETGHLTAGPRSLWGAEAGSSLGVTGCPMAVAGELAGRAITARGAGLKAVGGLQARGTGTCPTLGVTGAAVATAAGLVTLWSPHSQGTVTGAVVTSPAWHTLALIGCHTAAVHTLLDTERHAGLTALVEALAALQALPVVRLHHLAVDSPVDNRGLRAGVGALPGPTAGLRGEQTERPGVGLLGGGGEAFPEAAGIGVIGFEGSSQPQAQGQEEGAQRWRHCRGLRHDVAGEGHCSHSLDSEDPASAETVNAAQEWDQQPRW